MAGFLFPRTNSNAPEIAGFRVQTSVYGLPVPIVYGAARIAGNLIHYLPQAATAAVQRGSKWAPKQQTGWNYRAAVALALCEGPLAGWDGDVIGHVWADKDEPVEWSEMDGWDLFTGLEDQDPWDYLTDNYPAQAVPYQHTVYVANRDLELPNNVIPNYSWEIYGLFMFDPDGGILDALPSDILPDLLTDANHGIGFPAASLGDLTDFEDYCAAAGIFVSPALASIEQTRATIDLLMLAGNSALVWSEGVLKVIPRGDTALSGNGHTYTPNTTPIYDLTDDDYLAAEGEDPVQMTRVDPADAFNAVTVEFESRFDDEDDVRYDVDTAEATADDAIVSIRRLPAPRIPLRMVKDRNVARTIAQTELQRHQLIRNTYRFKTGWKFSLLEPMDLITLTDTALGLSLTPVRITEVVELADAAGIQFTAEEWPTGTATATLYPSQNGGGFKPDLNVAPGDTVIGAIFEPVVDLLRSPFEVWIAASGGAHWGGCEVYLSGDGDTYSHVGTIRAKSRFGVLTDSLNSAASWPAIDSVHTLAIDITASGGEILSPSADDFANFLPMAWIGGEFLIYGDAALTSPFNYDLTSMGRGLYATIQTFHVADDPVVLIDEAIFKLPFAQAQPTNVLYFKFLSFNEYGNALQAIEDVAEYTHTLANDPSPNEKAAAQGTVSIDENGNASATSDGSSRALSWRWDYSTSAYPDDNTVAASGTLAAGRTFSETDFTTLEFGETVYLTLVPFTLTLGDGFRLPSIHLRGSYQSFSATKSVTYSRTAWKPVYAFTSVAPLPAGFTDNSDGSPGNPLLPDTSGQVFEAWAVVNEGVLLGHAYFDYTWSAGASADIALLDFVCGLGTTDINNGSSSTPTGAATIDFTLDDTPATAGDRIYFRGLWLGPLSAGPDADANQCKLHDITITYLMPTPDKTP